MSRAHTIGQRFMVGVRGARAGDPLLEADLDACLRAGIGGVILFDRDVRSGHTRNVESIVQVRRLIEHIRTRLGGSVRVAVDQEGGRVARFRSDHGFVAIPSAKEIGAMAPGVQREHARAMARDLRDVGIDMNFAPCTDLDLGCPVISGLDRSFGAAENVVRSARILVEELEAHGVTACIKHFPGHGSASLDSHEDLPDVSETFVEQELGVFRELLQGSGPPGALMTGHVLHRGLDAERPASVSRAVSTELLRAELGFDGLIVTDSLDMGALRRRYSLEEAAELALDAGADIIVHACNSALGETAEDVARVVEQLEG